MRFDFRRRFRIFLEEDSGGGTGGTENIPADNIETKTEGIETSAEVVDEDKSEEPELQAPGYFSQLPGDKAKSEAYKALYKYQRLDDVTDALLAADKRLAELQSDRALIVPEKGDKEGAAAFARKLGVPDEPSGYKMDALAEVNKTQPELVEAIRKGCRRMLLTTRQGEAIGEMIASVNKANAIHRQLEIRNNLQHQSERVAALYKDTFSSDIDRNNAAAEDISRYESFLKETGLEELFNSSLLAGNPKMIKAISAYAKKHGGVVTSKGTGLGSGHKTDSKPVLNESEDWKRFKAEGGRL